MAIREGKWDCPACDTKGNRGSDLKCKVCNKQRADDVEFYLEEDADEVRDEKALAAARAGADWLCEFCNASNQATLAQCKSCGSPRGEKKREEKLILDAAAAAKAAPPPPPKPSGGGKLKWGVGALLLLGTCAMLFRPSERELKVEKVSWERTVDVEKLATVTESGWEEELPSGARVLSRERKFHHNDRVQTGTKEVVSTVDEQVKTGMKKVKVGKKNKGNGFFEDVYKDEPIYQTKKKTVRENVPVYREDPVMKDYCRYEVDKWVKDRTAKNSGVDKNPQWPPLELTRGLREGKKEETFLAVFSDGSKTYEWKAPQAKWQKLEVGRGYKLKLRMGSVEDLAE